MIHILEYIMQHYALFLGGAILILLSIIGYYADKTNFGQGKSIENKDDPKNITDITNLRLSDVTNSNSDFKLNNSQLQETDHETVQSFNNNVQAGAKETLIRDDVPEQKQELIQNTADNLNSVNLVNENPNIVNEHINNNENGQNNNDDKEKNVNADESQNDVSLLNTKEFDKFDDEFNSILPKKELITSDLLNDIDDLEFDKTQKLNLNDIPNLDDIELPKIKSSVVDKDDIWKF